VGTSQIGEQIMTRPGFLWGLVIGVAGVWAYHRFIAPLPGGKKG